MTFIKNIFIFGLLSVNSGSLLAEVSLPYTFQANTIAKAERAGTSSCDTNKILIGGRCLYIDDRTNNGVLFSYAPTKTSYIGGCFPVADTYNCIV